MTQKEIIPTAEEILNALPRADVDYIKVTKKDLKKAMKEFAKLHVEAQQKAILEKATTKEDIAIFVEGTFKQTVIDKDSIIKAYPLENIK